MQWRNGYREAASLQDWSWQSESEILERSQPQRRDGEIAVRVGRSETSRFLRVWQTLEQERSSRVVMELVCNLNDCAHARKDDI